MLSAVEIFKFFVSDHLKVNLLFEQEISNIAKTGHV